MGKHSKSCKTFDSESNIIKESKYEKAEDSILSNTKNATVSENNIMTPGNNLKTDNNSNTMNNPVGFTMKILEVEVLRDEFNNEFKDYLFEINIGNRKIFNINKRFSEFINLNRALKLELNKESIYFPETEIIFSDDFDFESNITAENIHALEDYFNEISSNKRVYYSSSFKKFFKISEEEESPNKTNNNYLSNPSSINTVNNLIGSNKQINQEKNYNSKVD